jgi:hypothetical protein
MNSASACFSGKASCQFRAAPVAKITYIYQYDTSSTERRSALGGSFCRAFSGL